MVQSVFVGSNGNAYSGASLTDLASGGTTRNQGEIRMDPKKERELVRIARLRVLCADAISARVGCEVQDVLVRLEAKAIRRNCGTAWIRDFQSSRVATRRAVTRDNAAPFSVVAA